MKTRTLEQTVTFKVSPTDVYEMIMDSRKHTSLSGEKAKISRKVGGSFTAWNGHISGFNLVLTPGEKIVAPRVGGQTTIRLRSLISKK